MESSEAGWASQKPRGSGTTFSENVKSYLQSRFSVGVETGRKSDPGPGVSGYENCEKSRRYKKILEKTSG